MMEGNAQTVDNMAPSPDESTRGARILSIDDEPQVHQLYSRALRPEGHSVAPSLSCEEGLAKVKEGGFDVILLDFKLPDGDGISLIPEIRSIAPDVPIIMVTSHGSTQRAVRAIREGAHDFLEKPFGIEALRVSVANALRFRRLSGQAEFHREVAFNERYLTPAAAAGDEDLFTGLPEETTRVLMRAAPTRATILVSGETGVGKEHVSALVHQVSGRDGAFVAVNCAAIPAHLAESELFGYEKGAFTGADTARPGKFEIADGGTLFLDEIGELPTELQPKLLRAVETGETTRIGARAPRHVDVRILAATNRDLEAEVSAGNFREDLFFRLNVLQIEIPPLRARREVVRHLAEKFLVRASAQIGRRFEGFAGDALELFSSYPFPGNVRELANAVERATILEEGTHITAASLGLGARIERGPVVDPSRPFRDARDDFDRAYFRALLKQTEGNISEAARRAGLHRNNLRAHLKRLGLLEGSGS